jgi:hypothetical protein
VEKKNHHSLVQARHDSTQLCGSDSDVRAAEGRQGNNERRATAAPIEVTVRAGLGKTLEMHYFV